MFGGKPKTYDEIVSGLSSMADQLLRLAAEEDAAVADKMATVERLEEEAAQHGEEAKRARTTAHKIKEMLA